MKINIRQISAGLALSGMTHNELATASGVDAESLARILKGEVTPRPESIDRIKIALEGRQVEFGARSGVALRDDYMRRLQGTDAFVELMDDIIRVMFGRNDDVLFFMVDPAKSTPEVIQMEHKLYDAGINCRFICSEENQIFTSPREQYRLVPRKYFTNEVQIVYSNFLALNSITPTHNVLIINSPSAASAERGKFNFIWDNCRPPT